MSWLLRLVGWALLVLLVGNVAILATSATVRWRAPVVAPAVAVEGVGHLAVVDANVWRGAAPDQAGYRDLAAAGVTTVIDLRAEHDAGTLDPEIRALGLHVVHVPVRDGQAPTEADVDRVVRVVEGADGLVFLHCGAGVGRTGAMAAAYLVRTGQADSGQALARNLAIGPPSLEQIVFTARLRHDHASRPPALVVALSRFLDSPRRLWSAARG